MKKKIHYFAYIALIPIVTFLLFSILAEGFGLHSIIVILNQTMLPTAMGLGMAACLLSGMTDLSIGARVVLGAVAGGILARQWGLIGLVIGCFVGNMAAAIVQAGLYHILRIPSMVLSVGIIMLYEVVAAVMGGAAAHVRIEDEIAAFGSYPYNVIILGIACVLFYLFFYQTQVGWQIKAVGNDEKLCKGVGLKTDRIKTAAYLISALLCGFASVLSICYSGTISIPTGMSTLTMIFKPIMGVMIGMQMVKFCDNLPLLIFVGELAIQIIFNGFIALGLTDAWQNVMLGMFILVVMYLTGDTAPSLSVWKKKVQRHKELLDFQKQGIAR